MKKKTYLIIIAVAVVLGLFLYVAYTYPDSSQLETFGNAQTKNAAMQMSKESSFPETMARAEEDLYLHPPVKTELEAVDGNYFLFSAYDAANGGGVEIIAYHNPDGTFSKVWQGQDIPNCFLIDHWHIYLAGPNGQIENVYTVPTTLVPQCYVTKTKNRRTPLSQIESYFSR